MPTRDNTDPPTCKECDTDKEYVDEPVISGIRGWFCTNDDCGVDG
jgi:hypothetical protein